MTSDDAVKKMIVYSISWYAIVKLSSENLFLRQMLMIVGMLL